MNILGFLSTTLTLATFILSCMFSKYVDIKNLNIVECDPYDFDFTILQDYYYEMPRVYSSKRIEYMQIGNEIVVPVDYVDSVLLIREELYECNINKHN